MFKADYCISEVNMSLYNELRAKHPTFIYHSYDLTDNGVEFHFLIGEHHFRPKWTFGEDISKYDFDRPLAEKIVAFSFSALLRSLFIGFSTHFI